MATSKEQKLKLAADYEDKAKKLKAEIKALEERQKALEAKRISAVKRKADTTAKILLGAATLALHKRMNDPAKVRHDLEKVLLPHMAEKDRFRLVAALQTLGLFPVAPAPSQAPENPPAVV